MTILKNPWRSVGLPKNKNLAEGSICTNPSNAQALFALCPKAAVTPLVMSEELSEELGVASVAIKDERSRMGLGSFKALGAAHAIAKRAHARMTADPSLTAGAALSDRTFVCASAGNHGLSLAAGAKAFGAQAVVFIAQSVPEIFKERLEDKGARVVRAGDIYEESMAAALEAAQENRWDFLPDSTWVGCTEPARDVMEGYLIMGEEVAAQIDAPPTHVLLQAGVGGLAAAAAASARRNWGDAPEIIIVEPEAAPALMESNRAGQFVATTGPVSNMGRLDCKEASHLALKYLAEEADVFVTISDAAAQATVDYLSSLGLRSTPSGVAGIAAARALSSDLGLRSDARLLVYLSEGPDD
ncbi:pyridoxal-phosphate dependent enzyme [Roseibium sp.]|uniref:pyridoxal-phosphate dependent enzyme n=1 Tax=Roseibium sp. TaxID=1936156 RepID=UPI003A97C0D7